MSTQRTQWHVLFYAALKEHGSPATEALAEVLLSKEPQQGDILLIRRHDPPGVADAAARTLRNFWRLVVRECLIEYKSPSRPPRPGDVAKLLGYGGQIHHLRIREIGSFRNLLLCLVVTMVSAGLKGEIEDLDVPVWPVAPGYRLVETRPYRILVVDLSAVVEADGDEWMSVFVPSTVLSAETRRWLEEHMPAKDVPANEKLEGHDEVLARLLRATPTEDILRAAGVDRLLGSLSPEQRLAGLPAEQRLADLSPEQRLADLSPEQRLAGLPPEQRLAGLPPEQRLADLSPEQQLLAMPVSALRALSEDYMRTLPDDVRAAIRKRIEQDR